MANKPPTPTYKRTFHVISHASNERYRERFQEAKLEHLDEEHLANYIDQSTVRQRKAGRGVEIIDTKDNVPGEIVPLSDDKILWALIKPNTNRRLSERFPFAIVTILRHHQVTRSLSGGRWIKKGEKPRSRSQSFTLPPEQLEKLEKLRLQVSDKKAPIPESEPVPIKLEFKNGSSNPVYRDCRSIKEAEELMNNPPEGLTFVRPWVPANTKEVKKTKLDLDKG